MFDRTFEFKHGNFIKQLRFLYSQLFNQRQLGFAEQIVGQMALDQLDKEKKDFSEKSLLNTMEQLKSNNSLNESMRHAADRMLSATRDVFRLGG